MRGRRQRDHPNEKRRRGFTLIELLTSIAVISILALLLTGAVSRAKEYGRRAVCMSNLRQIGQAFTLYFSENEGSFPFPTFEGQASLRFSVDSAIIDPFADILEAYYSWFDRQTTAVTVNWYSAGDWVATTIFEGNGNAILDTNWLIAYSTLYGGVAGEDEVVDAYGQPIYGTTSDYSFGPKDRILNIKITDLTLIIGDSPLPLHIFQCPSDDAVFDATGNSYAANVRLQYGSDGQILTGTGSLNFGNIKTLRDSRVVIAGDYGWSTSVFEAQPPYYSWHGLENWYNLLFLDGHVKFIRVAPGQYQTEDYTTDAFGYLE